jgi:uncharacterized protein (DUF58 family)
VVSGLLAFMSVTGLAGMYNIKGLIPLLLPPDEIFAGSATSFRLSLRNTKKHLPSFLIRLECPGNGAALVLPIVHQHDSSDGTIMLTFHQRGQVAAGHITISSTYPVGFFTRYWTIQFDSEYIIFPQQRAMKETLSGLDARRLGNNPLPERGIDGELERILPYSGREPVRMIHWKLSARNDDLLVKGFGDQSAPPLVIDLDRLPGLDVEERLSHAAWLVKQWVLKRPVGLVLGGREIPATCGKQHGLTLLKELALYGSD